MTKYWRARYHIWGIVTFSLTMIKHIKRSNYNMIFGCLIDISKQLFYSFKYLLYPDN